MEPGRYGVVGIPGFGGFIVRSVTKSWATHAFILAEDGQIIESWMGAGVRVGHISQYAGMRVEYNTDEMTPEQRAAVLAYARHLVGTPYDLISFIRFGLAFIGVPTSWLITKNPMRHAYICSRLVAAAGAKAGLDWAGGIMDQLVTPATLAARITERRTV